MLNNFVIGLGFAAACAFTWGALTSRVYYHGQFADGPTLVARGVFLVLAVGTWAWALDSVGCRCETPRSKRRRYG